MSDRSFSIRLARTLACLASAAGVALLLPAPAAAQPVLSSEIVQSALQGFGDRYNSQAWSMAWWKNKLYVGTGRASYCIQQATLVYFNTGVGSYPPSENDTECTPDAHDLPLQAEIWAWTPETDTWEMVYRSPNDVPIVGTDPVKFTARDVGYRGMLVFREADGTEALYVSGVTSRGAQGSGFNGPVPPPRLLRSVDGVTFNPVPQDPGTVLGDTTVTGFRSMVGYKGRLFLLASIGLLGHGIVYEAANPEQGNNAFRVISPPGMTFFEIDKYNGHLFLGTGVQPALDPTPFSLLKTDATGDPYTFTTVIPQGAFQKRNPSAAVISMQKFRGRLYVGTDRELLRVNPDDSWDLVVGAPRATPDGRQLDPLSGFDIGFDNFLNIHMWRMGEHGGSLLVGTQDQSTKWRNLVGAEFLRPRMGADFYSSADGWNFTMISRNGVGDLYNNGLRTFASTPYGLFIGSANHYYGTRIYRAVAALRPLEPPQRLAAETLRRAALLSWEPSPTAARYHLWRDVGYADPEEIAVIDATTLPVQTYLDTTVQGFKRYHYQVVAEDALGQLSGPSAMVTVPFIGPQPTFATLDAQLTAWAAPASLSEGLARARQAVRARDFDRVLSELALLRLAVQTDPTLLPFWRAQDLDVLLVKFARRAMLAQAGALPVRQLIR